MSDSKDITFSPATFTGPPIEMLLYSDRGSVLFVRCVDCGGEGCSSCRRSGFVQAPDEDQPADFTTDFKVTFGDPE